MNNYFVITIIFLLASCNTKNMESVDKEPKAENKNIQSPNLLSGMNHQDMKGMQWMNEPDYYTLTEGTLIISAPEGSDYFNDPATDKITGNAPFLFSEAEYNFIATTEVKPDFNSVWNGAALMVYIDSLHWAKLCYENSDATGSSVVTVVTNGKSDDANGPILQKNESIWLRIIRKENLYGLHWSLDGKDFKMVRLFSLPANTKVKIGMEAQCPAGKTAKHEFLHFSLKKKTVKDLRMGI